MSIVWNNKYFAKNEFIKYHSRIYIYHIKENDKHTISFVWDKIYICK